MVWGHYYQKPTHVWTNMYFWELSGTQEGGIGRCRQQCPYGEIGDKGRWVHKILIGQESRRVMGGNVWKGRQTVEQGCNPLGPAQGDMQGQAGTLQGHTALQACQEKIKPTSPYSYKIAAKAL